ncbi:MAG TPA: PA domain-containing protein [Woeseiaceae bacterium]|nr:PA domain-containing protein [Woeseiaceae bacterium]
MRIQNLLIVAATVFIGALTYSPADAANGPVVVGNITINIVDPIPSLGFDDTTPAAPVGGNPGTTVGEQRLEAYRRAAEIWDGILDIDVQIVLQASFVPLSCEATSGVLGSAGALNVFRDFPGPSFPRTWYGAALANNLAGADLNGSEPDPALLAPPFNDEIVSFFNSELGKPGCLENSSWYYGLDHNEPPGGIDFLVVLLHEVGHGLGFQNFADDASGANFLGFPDQWSRFQRDDVLAEKHWDQMIDAERQFSAVNGPNLVWTGPQVTAAAPGVLGPALVIRFNAPPDLAGEELPFGTASFGPPVPAAGITGDIVLVNDGVGTASDACEPIANDLTGAIALLDRGSCTFVLKAQNAEAAGAIAVIIANNVAGNTPIGLGGSGVVGVPTVSATQAGGALLRQNPGTNVTIGAPSSDGSLSGTDPGGLVRLYAPSPVAPGSSVAHYDVSANPNLLMEPSINADLSPSDPAVGVDLTDELLRDVGWDGNVSCPVDANDIETVNVFGCDTGVPNRQGTYTVIPSKTWGPGQFGAVAGGCYLMDVIDACLPLIDFSGGGGQYQSCIAAVTSDLKQQGELSMSEAGAIKNCATTVAPLMNP